MKKYEIYLPLKYNDGIKVEPEKLKDIEKGSLRQIEILITVQYIERI